MNTNTYAASGVIRYLVGAAELRRALIIGTGATGRSVALGLTWAFPHCSIGIIGRSPDKAATIVTELGLGEIIVDPAGFQPDLVVNASTVGQLDDHESLPFDLSGICKVGTRYFDVNTRASALQIKALSAGCLVASGVVMQVLTTTLRAGLLASRNVT